MKKSIVVLTILALVGAFWASTALAEWRVGDFTDQAFLGEEAKAKSEGAEPTAFKENASEKISGEKTDFLPSPLFDETTWWNG